MSQSNAAKPGAERILMHKKLVARIPHSSDDRLQMNLDRQSSRATVFLTSMKRSLSDIDKSPAAKKVTFRCCEWILQVVDNGSFIVEKQICLRTELTARYLSTQQSSWITNLSLGFSPRPL